MSLFSPFDLYWFILPLSFIFLVICSLYVLIQKSSPLKTLLGFISRVLLEFFVSLKPKHFNKRRGLIFLGVFIFLVVINFFSVFSFNFPHTSQVSLVLVLAGGFWLSLVFFSIFKNLKGFVSHIIPEGTPLPLTSLLFVIELVRNIIRPLTLTVRLVANILAGHLLIRLLSSLVFVFNITGILYVGLNIVEIFVAIIQAYIFTTIIVLYFSEV